MLIYEHPNLVAVSGALAIASLVGLIVQAALDEPWIVPIGLGGWMLAVLLEKAGVNGAAVVMGLTLLAALTLVAKFLGKSWRKPRVWSPLLGLILATAALWLLAG